MKSGGMKRDGNEQGDILQITDPLLNARIRKCMRVHYDVEEIRNDPSYAETMTCTKELVSSYYSRKDHHDNKSEERRKFITGALTETRTEITVQNDLKTIRYEMGKSNISEITADWVNEWHKNKQLQGSGKNAMEERKQFISSSLSVQDKIESYARTGVLQASEEHPGQIKTAGNRTLRYVYMSVAASVVGAALIISTLMPPPGPDKLFSSYYEPFEAISPIVRDGNNSVGEIYSSAVKYYKAGDFEKAAQQFMESSLKDPSVGSPLFYLGLTDLATGRYDKAIVRLGEAASIPDAYSKEAKWYLGLAYLKNGEISKARDCFSALSATEGYYKDRSDKILRRLK